MSARDDTLCTIDGRGYVLDLARFRFEDVDPTRQGIDQGVGSGPTSLTNEIVWRRVRDNWIGGAGQEYADLEDELDPSQPIRFRSSSNIDPWSRRTLTVGRPRVVMRTLTGTARLAGGHAAGNGAIWVTDGAKVALYDLDPADGTTAQLGTDLTLAAGVPLDITSFGGDVLYVVNADNTFGTVTYSAGLAYAALGAATGDMIAACGSRLLAANGAELFELAAAGTKTTIYTHWSSSFSWDGAVATHAAIYAWGSLGGSSQLFRLPISDATGAIGAPIPAAPLPLGETVTDVLFHAGILMIGTNQGVRMALIDNDGGISYGPLNDDVGSVRQLAAYGTFVMAAASEGTEVWRLDPGRFVAPLLPAFASESEYLSTGATATGLAVASTAVTSGSDSYPAVAVASSGEVSFYADQLSGVPLFATSGEIDLGWFTYGLGESLSLDSITVECDPEPGGSTHTVTAYVDTPEFQGVITLANDFSSAARLTGYAPYEIRAARFRVRLVLAADTAAGTAPAVRSVTLRVAPAPFISDRMLLPLLLHDGVETEHGQQYGQAVLTEWNHLLGLRDSRERVTLTLGDYSATVRVEALSVAAGGLGGDNGVIGYDQDDAFLAGVWNVEVVTLQDEAVGTTIYYGDDATLISADHYGGAYA